MVTIISNVWEIQIPQTGCFVLVGNSSSGKTQLALHLLSQSNKIKKLLFLEEELVQVPLSQFINNVEIRNICSIKLYSGYQEKKNNNLFNLLELENEIFPLFRKEIISYCSSCKLVIDLQNHNLETIPQGKIYICAVINTISYSLNEIFIAIQGYSYILHREKFISIDNLEIKELENILIENNNNPQLKLVVDRFNNNIPESLIRLRESVQVACNFHLSIGAKIYNQNFIECVFIPNSSKCYNCNQILENITSQFYNLTTDLKKNYKNIKLGSIDYLLKPISDLPNLKVASSILQLSSVKEKDITLLSKFSELSTTTVYLINLLNVIDQLPNQTLLIVDNCDLFLGIKEKNELIDIVNLTKKNILFLTNSLKGFKDTPFFSISSNRIYPVRKNCDKIIDRFIYTDSYNHGLIELNKHQEGNLVFPKLPLISSYSIALSALGVLPYIRSLFARTNIAKSIDITSADLDLRNKLGSRCNICYGTGLIDLEICTSCNGTRFKSEVSSIKYRGYCFNQILKLNLFELRDFFKLHRKVTKLLDVALKLNLGKIVGETRCDMLSSGEYYRLNLSRFITISAPLKIGFPEVGINVELFDNFISLLKERNGFLGIASENDIYLELIN
jgi:hypothetical protein